MSILTLASSCFAGEMALNTSNPGKLEEFQRLFGNHGITLKESRIDLAEIDASPEKVVAHKASQLDEGVWVEDTSLNVDGADVGVNIRWFVEHLDRFIGAKAEWVVILGCRTKDQVALYQGLVHGTIVAPRGEGGFGFDPYFLPAGESQTLAESKPNRVNARAVAVNSVANGEVWCVEKAIVDWDGPWQHED